MKKEVIKYKNGTLVLDVQVSPEEETVWLTQEQMSKLFGVNSQAISKHVSNIYKQDELKENSTCSKMEQVQKEGERTIKRTVKFYNLDMIISVGYRVNSKQGIAFRKWATSILKDYMIKGYAVNQKRLEILQKTINLQSKMLSSSLETNKQLLK